MYSFLLIHLYSKWVTASTSHTSLFIALVSPLVCLHISGLSACMFSYLWSLCLYVFIPLVSLVVFFHTSGLSACMSSYLWSLWLYSFIPLVSLVVWLHTSGLSACMASYLWSLCLYVCISIFFRSLLLFVCLFCFTSSARCWFSGVLLLTVEGAICLVCHCDQQCFMLLAFTAWSASSVLSGFSEQGPRTKPCVLLLFEWGQCIFCTVGRTEGGNDLTFVVSSANLN